MGTDLEVGAAPLALEEEAAVDELTVLTAPPGSPPVAPTVAPVMSAPAPRIHRFWRDTALGVTLVILAHVFLVQISVVRGVSMSPSLHDGDRLVVDRVSYSIADVSRFDVVVLRYPRNPDIDFVKRVVGLPGDEVTLRDGLLHVNGAALDEGFCHVADDSAQGSWVVPQGKYFVLGDNRPISCDSREFGMVDHAMLKGKVRACFWPLDRIDMF